MNINVWNGHVFSYFSVGGKTVYQIRVEGPNVLVEFQFDTDRYLFEDFDTSKFPNPMKNGRRDFHHKNSRRDESRNQP